MDFINGKSSMSLEEFEEEFVKQRTLFWLRKVKSEKMKELLLNYKPTPAPRTIHNCTSDSSMTSNTPPYPNSSSPSLHSLPPQSRAQSLPDPAASLPPYPNQPGSMPSPDRSSLPFPAAAYTSYPKPVPVRPPAYSGPSRFAQHRF